MSEYSHLLLVELRKDDWGIGLPLRLNHDERVDINCSEDMVDSLSLFIVQQASDQQVAANTDIYLAEWHFTLIEFFSGAERGGERRGWGLQ